MISLSPKDSQEFSLAPQFKSINSLVLTFLYDSLVAQRVKRLPVMQETQETWVRSLGGEDLLKEEMATHSSIFAWKIPWTEEPGGLQSMEPQRVRHN